MRRFGPVRTRRARQAQAHALDAAGIGVHHLELGARGMGDHLALRRQMPHQLEDQPSQGVDILVILPVGQDQSGFGLDIAQRGAGLDQPLARLFQNPQAALGLVMLVLDLADDLLDQILDCLLYTSDAADE